MGHALSSLLQHMPYSSGSTYVYRAEAGQGEVTSAQFLQGSAISLQSMFSETVSIGFVVAGGVNVPFMWFYRLWLHACHAVKLMRQNFPILLC